MTRLHHVDGVTHSMNVPEDLDADGKDDYTPGIKLRDLGEEDVNQFPGLKRQHWWRVDCSSYNSNAYDSGNCGGLDMLHPRQRLPWKTQKSYRLEMPQFSAGLRST